MKIEIQEFYPFTKEGYEGCFLGTLHVYLIDLNMDIRGIEVLVVKNKYKFYLPKKYEMKKGYKIWYPVINFLDNNKNKELKKELNKKGLEFIKNYMNEQNKQKEEG